MKGVKETEVGYMGGTKEDPTYDEVSEGETGHAETVHILFDPKEITYEQLLDVFWNNHDPTTVNRQGPDQGTQYRSVIFYHTDQQKKLALQSKNKQEKTGRYKRPIVTEISKAYVFYPAEQYHQKYLMKRGEKSCRMM